MKPFLAVAATLALAGCDSQIPLTTNQAVVHVDDAATLKSKVDVLFVLDDSASMAPKVDALRARFSTFIAQLDALGASRPASYHIGVVTSSLGAPGFPSSCPDLGARLQQRGLATSNAAGCEGPVGMSYLVYDQLDPSKNNIPVTQTLDQTFACMAAVVDADGTFNGHVGCGFESQLETAYRALHDTTITENAGFLRDDAVLAVVWVTDEDDCSADPGSDVFSDPVLGPVNSFRCAQNGIVCDGQLLPSAPQASFAHCAPATAAQNGNRLTDLDKYVAFFTKSSTQGGVKNDPHDVVLAAIAAPATPVGTVQATGVASCGADANGMPVQTCTNIAHSCTSAADPTVFGDPAMRLSYVVSQAQNNGFTSICADDYAVPLSDIATQIAAARAPTCVSVPLATVGSRPDCNVTDRIGTVRSGVPYCGDNGGARPCWTTTTAASCPPVCNPSTGQLEDVAIAVERTQPLSPGDQTEIVCNAEKGGTLTCS